MDDELGAAAQRALAGGVHVADDHVRREALLEQGIGAAVDGDENRAHVADERPQRAQVALVAHPARHDERRAIAQVGAEPRHRDASREQLALLAHVLHRVEREALERLVYIAAPGVRLGADALRVEHLAASEQLAPAQDLRARSPVRAAHPHDERLAVRHRREQRVVGEVHEQDPRLDEQLRAQVRIGAARGAPAVEHHGGARRDQLLGGDAIDVEMVDQRDVASHERSDEQLRAPPRPHRPRDAQGKVTRPWRQRRREILRVTLDPASRRSHLQRG